MNDEVNPADLPLLLRGSVQPGDYLTSNVANRLLYAAADYIESKLADARAAHDELVSTADELQAALARQEADKPAGAVERALSYLDQYLSGGPISAPDWAIQLASILTGGDGCGATPSTPVGQEPVGTLYVAEREGKKANVLANVVDLPEGKYQLYAAPPAAQAVDLEQFREAVNAWNLACTQEANSAMRQGYSRDVVESLEAKEKQARDLIALIDQQAGKGVSDAQP